jgi:hypothetical protein
MRVNLADGGDPLVDRVAGAGLERHRAGLGHAVADGDLVHVHVGLDRLHHLDRAGRAGHDPGAQAGQVEVAEAGVLQLGDEHRRCHRSSIH